MHDFLVLNTDAVLATGSISIWVLIFGLFFPRLTLALAWLANAYPPNMVPLIVSFVGWLFVPRFLIAYYIYTDMGLNNVWFWAYLVTGFVGMFGEGNVVHRRVIRRTRVTRDGNTTTTVEEEEV